MAKDKTKHKYLVGFVGDHNVVYGRDEYSEKFGSNVASYTRPMTLLQAKSGLRKLGGDKTIYELKPVSNLAVRVRTEMMKKKQKRNET